MPKFAQAKFTITSWGIGSRVAQLDADLGRLACQGRVGVDGDLPLGIGGVGEGMEGYRRAEGLAETTNQVAIDIGFHVDNRCIIRGQGLPGGWGDRQGDLTDLSGLHIR